MCLKLMGDEKTILPIDEGPEILFKGGPVPRLCKHREA